MNREQLLEERWRLANSFGWGPFKDGRTAERIAEIDRILDLRNKCLATWDQTQAQAEGWALMYSTRRGQIEIQRDDEATVFRAEERLAKGLPVFVTDEDAWVYVRNRAAAGSTYHAQALAIVETQAMWPE